MEKESFLLPTTQSSTISKKQNQLTQSTAGERETQRGHTVAGLSNPERGRGRKKYIPLSFSAPAKIQFQMIEKHLDWELGVLLHHVFQLLFYCALQNEFTRKRSV